MNQTQLILPFGFWMIGCIEYPKKNVIPLRVFPHIYITYAKIQLN